MQLIKHPKHNADSLKDLLKTFKTIERHGMCKILGRSEIGKRLTKKSRADKTPRPDWLDEGTMCYSWFSPSVKHDYTTALHNKQDAAGYEKNFEAEESRVSDPDPDFPNGVVRKGKNGRENQKYVRLFPSLSANKNVESVYINGNGEDITDRITPEIRANFFPKKSESKKQAEYGVEGKNQVQVREYKADNIFYIQKGEKVIYNFIPKQILDLFDLELVG
jgi:hypothetical protein